jgi:TrmH family RNA methyltransferase
MNNITLDRIRIVLSGTTHPGNIGAAARAMKTMGLGRLVLVAPKLFPCAEATARASGADDILANALVYDTLRDAVSDCVMVYGTSARLRTLSAPLVEPEQAAAGLLEYAGRSADVAIVFGRERTGLTNEELDLCHKMVVIPSNPDFSSLNLAAAVQIICYELCKQVQSGKVISPVGDPEWSAPVSAEALDHFYTHLDEVMIQTGFLDPLKPRRLMRRLKQLFNRTNMDQNEYNILRGILTSVQESLSKK